VLQAKRTHAVDRRGPHAGLSWDDWNALGALAYEDRRWVIAVDTNVPVLRPRSSISARRRSGAIVGASFRFGINYAFLGVSGVGMNRR